MSISKITHIFHYEFKKKKKKKKTFFRCKGKEDIGIP